MTRILEVTNTEGELITLEQLTEGDYKGRFLLVMHDDAPSKATAVTLIDIPTIKFLEEIVARVDKGTL